MVLLDVTRCMPLSEIIPEIRMIREPLVCSAESSADAEVTVTVEPPAPPVVPPFWAAQPTRPELLPPPPPPPPPEALVKPHCLFVLPVHESWMMAAPEDVLAPETARHQPLPTFLIWYVPEPLAGKVKSWLLCALPQAHC